MYLQQFLKINQSQCHPKYKLGIFTNCQMSPLQLKLTPPWVPRYSDSNRNGLNVQQLTILLYRLCCPLVNGKYK
jgi:hypothetical protein